MSGHNWPMFLFGFLGVFVVTQMYGLPISQRMRWLIWIIFTGIFIGVYNYRGWETWHEIFFVSGTLWGCAIIFAGLILLIQPKNITSKER